VEATDLAISGRADLHVSGGICLEHVRREVLTAVIVKSAISLDVTWCSPVEIHRRFEGTYCLLDSEDGGGTIRRNSYQTTRRFTSEKIVLSLGTHLCSLTRFGIRRHQHNRQRNMLG
jgi:hypothetical protein